MLSPRTIYDSKTIGDGRIYETELYVGDLQIFITQNKKEVLFLKSYTNDDWDEDISLIEEVNEEGVVTSTSLYKIEAHESLSDVIKNLSQIKKFLQKL